MMNFKELYVRAEITIWELLIGVMLQSRTVQSMLCKSHSLIYGDQWFHRIPKPILLAVAGVGIGFILGLIGALITT